MCLATAVPLRAQGDASRPGRIRPSAPAAETRGASAYRHLEGRFPVRDSRLERVFDAAVTAVVSLQATRIRDEAKEEVAETAGYRFERREPLGERELRQLQPAHIPAVQVVRIPL